MDGGTGNESKPSIPEAARNLRRCSPAEAGMRSRLVVIAPPALDRPARIRQRVEHLLVEALGIMEQEHQT
jgi:hypothetical protein